MKRGSVTSEYFGSNRRCLHDRERCDKTARTITKFKVHPALPWVKIESAAVEQDGFFEILEVSKAACSSLDRHDLSIDPIGDSIRDPICTESDECCRVFLSSFGLASSSVPCWHESLGDANHRKKFLPWFQSPEPIDHASVLCRTKCALSPKRACKLTRIVPFAPHCGFRSMLAKSICCP